MLFSFNKILLLVLVLLAVWYGFKLVGRLDRARKQKLREKSKSGNNEQTNPENPENSSLKSVDLVRGQDGKTFVVKDSNPDT